MTDESFDHFITKRRRDLEMSLGDVAQALDVSPITVSNWSNGYSLPDSAQLRGLADLLEVPVKDLSDMSGVPIWDGGEADFVPEQAAAPETEPEPAPTNGPVEAARKVQLAPSDAVTPLGEETAEEWLSEEPEAAVTESGVRAAVEPITDDVGLPTVEAVPQIPAAGEPAATDSSVSVMRPPRDEFEDFVDAPLLEPTYVEDTDLLLRYRIRWVITGVILLIMLFVFNWAVGNMWDTLKSGIESVVPGS